MLTLLSVKFGPARLLERNLALVRRLNPGVLFQWIVVNNDLDQGFASASAGVRVVPGVPAADLRVGVKDRGSAHHAAGLMVGLSRVTTRYVLLLDHDFYVVRPDWIHLILAHVQTNRLAFFGSVWHPRWSYQPRDFPSVHFLLIDLEQAPTSALDFRPDPDGDRLDALISHPRAPIPASLRTLLQVGRFRDTGWRVRERFRRSGLPFECLVPHFDRTGALGAAPPLHRLAQRMLPGERRVFPSAPGSFTPESFLRAAAPSAYERGWEEFYWRGEPFALHLRSVGRRAPNFAEDEAELDRVLAHSADLSGQ